MSDPMAWAIRKSEDGPKVIRFLYEHPEERQRIYNIAPTVSLQDGRIIPVPANRSTTSQQWWKWDESSKGYTTNRK